MGEREEGNRVPLQGQAPAGMDDGGRCARRAARGTGGESTVEEVEKGVSVTALVWSVGT